MQRMRGGSKFDRGMTAFMLCVQQLEVTHSTMTAQEHAVIITLLLLFLWLPFHNIIINLLIIMAAQEHIVGVLGVSGRRQFQPPYKISGETIQGKHTGLRDAACV